jgi:CDGSH-type Zn-finger protein
MIPFGEEIKAYKKKKHYSGLLGLLDQLDRSPISEENDDHYKHIISFFTDSISGIRKKYKQINASASEKIRMIQIISWLPAPEVEDIQFLLNLMIYDDDTRVRWNAFKTIYNKNDTLCRLGFTQNKPLCALTSHYYGEQVTKILESSVGRRIGEYLPQVIANSNNETFIENCLKTLSERDRFFKNNCELVVKNPNQFFLAMNLKMTELDGLSRIILKIFHFQINRIKC